MRGLDAGFVQWLQCMFIFMYNLILIVCTNHLHPFDRAVLGVSSSVSPFWYFIQDQSACGKSVWAYLLCINEKLFSVLRFCRLDWRNKMQAKVIPCLLLCFGRF